MAEIELLQAREAAGLQLRKHPPVAPPVVDLGQVVDDTEEGRITPEGFDIFSVTWEAVNEAIGERLGEMETGS